MRETDAFTFLTFRVSPSVSSSCICKPRGELKVFPHSTFIGFLTGESAHVLKGSGTTEGFTTLLTYIWFLASVSSQDLKIGEPMEGFHIPYIDKVSLQCEFFHVFEMNWNN